MMVPPFHIIIASLFLFLQATDAWASLNKVASCLKRTSRPGRPFRPSIRLLSGDDSLEPVHLCQVEEPKLTNVSSILEYDLNPFDRNSPDTLFALGSNVTSFALYIKHITCKEPDTSRIRNRTCNPAEEHTLLKQLWESSRLLVQDGEQMQQFILMQTTFVQRLNGFTKRMITYLKEMRADTLQELRHWMFKHWNDEVTKQNTSLKSNQLIFDRTRNDTEQLIVLKEIMVWFKRTYPYYYDACISPDCGHSGGNSFLGYITASSQELQYSAIRAELSHCNTCGRVNRFPRFNNVRKVLFESRRGRCGEYSMCALALFECLGYNARWVVDWADHVWVEVEVRGRWVHCDPCEAAVDEPFIYEGWGKKPTYIVALGRTQVQDVTSAYVTDVVAMQERRQVDQGEIDAAISTSLKELHGASKCL